MSASTSPESELDPPDWLAWFDGQFLRAEEVALPARSPWALYGESVFETIAVLEGELGFEREHADRLERAAAAVLQRKLDSSKVFGAARELAGRLGHPAIALRVTLACAESGGLHQLIQARPLRRFGAPGSRGEPGLHDESHATILCSPRPQRLAASARPGCPF